MLVLDETAKLRVKSNNSKVFMWAALLHDICKPTATTLRKGRIGINLEKKTLNYFIKS